MKTDFLSINLHKLFILRSLRCRIKSLSFNHLFLEEISLSSTFYYFFHVYLIACHQRFPSSIKNFVSFVSLSGKQYIKSSLKSSCNSKLCVLKTYNYLKYVLEEKKMESAQHHLRVRFYIAWNLFRVNSASCWIKIAFALRLLSNGTFRLSLYLLSLCPFKPFNLHYMQNIQQLFAPCSEQLEPDECFYFPWIISHGMRQTSCGAKHFLSWLMAETAYCKLLMIAFKTGITREKLLHDEQ